MAKKKAQVFCRQCKAYLPDDTKSREGLCRKCKKERNRDFRRK